jgi:DnaJ-class molecular chaperone
MNYYDILELKTNASQEDIRSSYKKLALQYHPDRNPNGKERFQQIADAYNILSDDTLRHKYDLKQTLDFTHKNAFDTWKSLFPQDISNEVLSKIVKQIFDLPIDNTHFEIIYKYILETIKIRPKGKKRTLYIKAYYDINKLFEGDYEKDIIVEMTHNNKSRKWEYQLDIRQSHFYFLEEINENTQNMMIHININLIPNGLPSGYDIRESYDLLVDIPITLIEYYNDIIFIINHFGEYLRIHCKNINESYLLYKIPNKGLPYNKYERGDLYIKLVLIPKTIKTLPTYIIDKDIYQDSIKSYQAIMVDFFANKKK